MLRQFAQRRLETRNTVAELDRRLGVADGLVAKYECATRRPSLYVAHCWAQALGCNLQLVPFDPDHLSELIRAHAQSSP